jgi:hypothetical protein
MFRQMAYKWKSLNSLQLLAAELFIFMCLFQTNLYLLDNKNELTITKLILERLHCDKIIIF